MADTTGRWHALTGCYGRQRRAGDAMVEDDEATLAAEEAREGAGEVAGELAVSSTPY